MAKLPGAVQGARIVGERFVRSRRQHNPEGRMPLMDRLRELRNRVVKIALGLIAGMIIGFIFFNPLWHVIEHPLCSAVIRGHTGCHTLGTNQLVLNGPLDAFYLRVKVAVVAGAVLSSPVWLYQIWAFVAPGLHVREKRWSYLFLGTAVPLFLTGVTLAYWSLGRSMHYLLGLTPNHVSNLIQVDQYMSFVMTMLLAFGIAFEVPLAAPRPLRGPGRRRTVPGRRRDPRQRIPLAPDGFVMEMPGVRSIPVQAAGPGGAGA